MLFAQFFNTSILILLVNANLGEHQPKILTQFIHGSFSDYVPAWYSEVGTKILQTMMINSIVPYASLASTFFVPFIKQKFDQRFTGDKYVSRQKTMVAYKEIYSGTVYLIHFRYADLLNTLYVTMMYGVGIPLLFPLSAFTMFNTWLVERLTLAYLVRQPAAMDDRLSKNALALAKWAPILLLFNGYWMLGNRQIFMNKWDYIMKEQDPMPSGHYLPDYFELSWTTPVYIFLFASIVIIIVQAIVPRQVLTDLGFTLQSKEIVVDEDLPNFFTTMKPQQASNLTEEAKNLKFNYLMEI